MLTDTIVAQVGYQTQAINIVRVSGDEAKSIVNQILKYDITDQASHTIKHNYVVVSNEVVDEVMVSYFQAPKSYTKEDVLEINVHGSLLVTNQIVSALIARGARLALPGEFTQRAYLNNRIDLTQAEAINELIQANTKYRAKSAISGVCGETNQLIKNIMNELLAILANIAVNIDYPEYDDVIELTNEIILPQVKMWESKLNEIIVKSENSLLVKSGITTAIIGEPNVGKSSLLNALIKEDKALVSDIAGTTRDYVEGDVVIDNLHLRLIDTAGLRESEDKLELMGMEKTKMIIDKADLILLVVDGSKALSKSEKQWLEMIKDKKHLLISNKKDLGSNNKGIAISALNNDINPLIEELKKMYDIDEVTTTTEILGNQRQVGLMKQAQESLQSAILALSNYQELELVSIDINQAYQQLADIIGEYHRQDLFDNIFGNFCLGK